jgi:hypothetical protein
VQEKGELQSDRAMKRSANRQIILPMAVELPVPTVCLATSTKGAPSHFPKSGGLAMLKPDFRYTPPGVVVENIICVWDIVA